MAVLGRERQRDFEDRMLSHIRLCLGALAGRRTDDELRDIVSSGVTHASEYGITYEYEVCLFVDVMLLLGTDFDNSATHPWAREILTDAARRGPRATVDLLYQTAHLIVPREVA